VEDGGRYSGSVGLAQEGWLFSPAARGAEASRKCGFGFGEVAEEGIL